LFASRLGLIHYCTMSSPHIELLPTRVSLLERMKDWQNQASWQQFFDTYWKLIYGVARQANLSDAEAQDVVQDVLLHVAKQMPGFKYDPAVGSFKGWLLTKTRWCVIEQLRRRGRIATPREGDSTTGMDRVEQMADPSVQPMEEIWEKEWQQNLLEAALARLKRRFDPLKLQIFDFYVRKEFSAEEVAARFSVPIEQVYLAKHRVTEALKEEVERLEREVT
jgi:RNA polymerase sigma-70 factor (ECF subfamily)